MSVVKTPKSKLLARLDATIAKKRNPIEQACLRAERAGFLARHGQFDEARTDLAQLHAQFDPRPNPAVSAWLCIAEGWLLHFESLSSGARDKMKRAQALSAAAGLTQLQGLASAWLAHLDYSHNDVDAMVRNVSLALELASPDNHAARARACMVVALAYHFAERLDRAQPWYARSREHAVAEGDETMQSALNYNISAHRVHHAMQAAIFGGDVHEQARHALAGTDCAENFDDWVGTESLDALLPMQRACLASVQGHYAQALALYEKHLADAQKQGLARLSSNYLADMAWCRWHLDDHSGALRDAKSAQASLDPTMHMDDRAAAHGRLAELFKRLDDADASGYHGAMARDCWAAHRKHQASILQALDGARLHG